MSLRHSIRSASNSFGGNESTKDFFTGVHPRLWQSKYAMPVRPTTDGDIRFSSETSKSVVIQGLHDGFAICWIFKGQKLNDDGTQWRANLAIFDFQICVKMQTCRYCKETYDSCRRICKCTTGVAQFSLLRVRTQPWRLGHSFHSFVQGFFCALAAFCQQTSTSFPCEGNYLPVH